MILQAASLVGAVAVLLAYFLITSLAYSPRNKLVLSINGFGSLLLFAIAVVYGSIGYMVLNAAWLLIVAHGWRKGDRPQT
jgi:hypothetical protein